MSATTENGTRRCPVCSNEYPVTKKFCRLDGAGLVDVSAEQVTEVDESLESEITALEVEGQSLAPSAIGAEIAVSLAGLRSSPSLVLTVPAAPSIVSMPSPEPQTMAVEVPVEALMAVVEEEPSIAPVRLGSKAVDFGKKNQFVRQLFVGAGVGVLLLALLGGGVYLTKQRTEQAPPAAVEVAKSPAQLEGEINRALRDTGLNEVFSAVDDRYVVLLKGTVSAESLKKKAIGMARSFPQVSAVKDMVFVVEQ